ncbi:CTBS [Mytilus edulis]|uniref:Di-N-acetylchitobiase n=1 Tax=Mytilus edulis TaxID=6550 RepID=A0A8S3U1C6_MYTED|nr:CTBS [Mytilus edulis]
MNTGLIYCVLVTLCLIQLVEIINGTSCPCSDPGLCKPIQNTSRKEIFVFSLSNHSEIWSKYDWSKITTVVMTGYINLDLMCHAHKNGARAVIIANYPKANMTNSTARAIWVEKQLQLVKNNYLDGINIDFEDAILKNETDIRDAYVMLVLEVYSAFKRLSPVYQVTVDVAWSPAGVDGRYYDYVNIGLFVDFLFVMAYDEQSQIRGPCIAGANSPVYNAVKGIKAYHQLGISPDKLVLGVPWYGYMYTCLNLTNDDVCFIKHVPFRGVNCSDAAGSQINYSSMKIYLPHSPDGIKWNNVTETPYFNFKVYNSTYQVQFDNPASLKIKFQTIQNLGVRGFGMWNADAVNYMDNSTVGIKERTEMWGAFPSF